MSVAYLVLKLLQNIVQKLGDTTLSPSPLPSPPLPSPLSMCRNSTKPPLS